MKEEKEFIHENFKPNKKRDMQVYAYMKQFIFLVAKLRTPFQMKTDMEEDTINKAARCFMNTIINTAQTIKDDIDFIDTINTNDRTKDEF